MKNVMIYISIFTLFINCNNPEKEKHTITEKNDSTQNRKAIDSSFSKENASELARMPKENNLPDSVKIVEEVELQTEK